MRYQCVSIILIISCRKVIVLIITSTVHVIFILHSIFSERQFFLLRERREREMIFASGSDVNRFIRFRLWSKMFSRAFSRERTLRKKKRKSSRGVISANIRDGGEVCDAGGLRLLNSCLPWGHVISEGTGSCRIKCARNGGGKWARSAVGVGKLTATM